MIDFVGLDLIEFRGLTLAGLSLRMEPTARLLLSVREGKEEVGVTTVVFEDLIHLNTSPMNLEDDTAWLIDSFDYSVTNNVFEGTLSCLGPEGQPGIEIKINCRQLRIMESDIDE